MRWGMLVVALFLFSLSSARADDDIAQEKEGIMKVMARMMKCNDLSAKAGLKPLEAEKVAKEMDRLGCATVSCDLMKIVDRFFPGAPETADTKAQMAALGVCR